MTTWLALSIRLVGLLGLLLNAQSISYVFSTAISLVWNSFFNPTTGGLAGLGMDSSYVVMAIFQALVSIAVIGFCVWLILRPHKLASRWLRSLAGKCPHCLYPRPQESTGPCSECGLGG